MVVGVAKFYIGSADRVAQYPRIAGYLTNQVVLLRTVSPTPMSLNWSKIIESLDDRRVIPILGCDAVPVIYKGRTAPLHEFLAVELYARLKELGIPIPEPASRELPELVRAICQLSKNRNLARNLIIGPLREHLVEIHRQVLAQVTFAPETSALCVFAKLPLIMTTAIDGAAHLALRDACGVATLPINLKRITTLTLEDLPENWNEPNRQAPPSTPKLYHLFGRIEKQDTFALTDDELIEYFLKLRGPNPPGRLLEALSDYDILLLGSGFPDWLLRFVARLARGRPFSELPERSFQLVAEKHLCGDHTHLDHALLGFLTEFNASNVWVYGDAHPVQFLQRLEMEIAARRQPASDVSFEIAEGRPALRDTAGHVFISFASENREIAGRLAMELGQRCRVWFDEHRLSGGEELTPELTRAIQSAHLFVPVISKETNSAARPRVFVYEWKKALEVALNTQIGLRPYIIPVIVDDLSYKDLAGEALKFTMQDLNLTFRYASPQSPETEPAAAFKNLIDDLEKNYRKVELALSGQQYEP